MLNIQEVYEQYFTIVYRYLLSLSHNTHIAEELTQETFFKALKKVDDFRGDCDLRVWLCQISRNTYYDYLKKNKKYAPELQEETEDTFSKDLLQNFSDKDTAFQVHKVLHRLSEPYKEVFSLRVFGELSFATISSLFGRSESWARVTYHRACKKIREELNHEDYL
jgi:RNA polymerase sigma-70 factor (ECF subfamily)